MAVTKIKPIKSTLSKALDYIQNPDKTDGKMLVSSFGCSYETADIEFEYTLSQALGKGNNLAFHLIQSFEPGEVDYETAHKIGKQLADAVTKGQHEYVLTTHIDKVVNAKGELAGAFAFGGEDVQAELLRADGVEVINGRVDLEKYGICVCGNLGKNSGRY